VEAVPWEEEGEVVWVAAEAVEDDNYLTYNLKNYSIKKG
jgi:hypothetical protein